MKEEKQVVSHPNNPQANVQKQSSLAGEKRQDNDNVPIGMVTGLIGGYVLSGALLIACPWLFVAEPFAMWFAGASILTGAKLGFDYDERKNK